MNEPANLKISKGPASTPLPEVSCVLHVHSRVGEGPVWSDREKVLYWVDVIRPSVNRFDPLTGENQEQIVSTLIGAILPANDGRLIAVTQHGLQWYSHTTGSLTPIYDPEAHLETNRFNDAKTDRKGRIWAGTMRLDASKPKGSLYRFDDPTSAINASSGYLVSNGMGWSPDDKTFYFTDTVLRTVFAFDFDAESGDISNRRPFVVFEEGQGKPDGLTVDVAGNVWIALWDGWRVACYSADGNLVRELDVSVARPTSCCFGGDGLSRLYITTASAGLNGDQMRATPLSGALFAVDLDVKGQATNEVIL